MDALQAIETRKSVRSYLERAIEPDKLECLVLAAGRAPKAGEFQISVILNPGLLEEINDKTLIAMKNSGNDFLMERAGLPGYQPLYGAPLLLLMSAPEGNPYSRDNCAAAVTNAALAATALGLGSCYVISPTLTLLTDGELAAKTGIPAGFKAVCGLLAGYAGPEKFPSPRQEFKNVNYCL